MTKRSFPMNSNKATYHAVLLDLGPLDTDATALGTMGDMTIAHQYQTVAIFVDEDKAQEWVGYAKEGHRMVVCTCEGFKTDIDISPLFDPIDLTK